MSATIVNIATRRATPAPTLTSREAIDALALIVERAKAAGRIGPEDSAAFAVYALAVLGAEWELRSRD
jgi:hypothetical protein